MSAARFIIVILLLVCVAGVLILPQVDLPDFVIPLSTILQVSHAHAAVSATTLFRSYSVKKSLLYLQRSIRSGNLSAVVAVDKSDVEFVLTQLCTHRC